MLFLHFIFVNYFSQLHTYVCTKFKTYYTHVDNRHKIIFRYLCVIEKTIKSILLPHEVVYLFDTVADDIEHKKNGMA